MLTSIFYIGSQAYHYVLSTVLIYKMKAAEFLLNLRGICWKRIEQQHCLRVEKNVVHYHKMLIVQVHKQNCF